MAPTLFAMLSWLAPSAQAATIWYADNNYGDASFDGLSAVITNGHGPKRYITDAITLAADGDQISVAPGFYQETFWNLDTRNLGFILPGLVDVVFYDPGQLDTVGDGIPDWWRIKYFGGDGTTTNLQSCAWADPDGDGYDNWEEYEAGDNPTNSNSHPNSMVVISSAWAIYANSNSVQITANVLSTNAAVNVKAAEYFLDVITGPDGSGAAMTATNGAFNLTNETAVATFTPSFPYGERHVIHLHAEGSDNNWTPFAQVLFNPVATDIVNRVKANYSQISDITFTMTSMEFVDNQAISTNTILFRQKGPYKMRWDNQTDGSVMIINGNQIGVIDSSGQLTPMFIAVGDDPTGTNTPQTHFYWDTATFQQQFTLGTVSNIPNQTATYAFSATPNAGIAAPYDSINAQVDMTSGAVTEMDYIQGGVTVCQMQQPSPMQIAPGVWFQTQQNWMIAADTNWTMQHTEIIQTNTIQINTGTLSDSLFNF
jgi:outer membrane lipoprotein-sorting protein